MAAQTIEFSKKGSHARSRLNQSPELATVAEVSASIAHLVNEPLTSMLANAQAAKRWLVADPPNLVEGIASVDRIARDARAAGETMERIRALFKQVPLEKKEASVSDVIGAALRLLLEDLLDEVRSNSR